MTTTAFDDQFTTHPDDVVAQASAEAIAYASSLPEVHCAKCEMKVLSKCGSDCQVPDAYPDRQQRGGDVDENGLLPCPFCGAKAFATYKTDDYDGVRKYSVHCHAQCGGKIHGRHYSEADAIAAWNARAAPAPQPAASAEPAAWVAADTLNSPHPRCVSSLAYMSQIDQDRGREYVPLYAAPVAAQKADDALDAERYRWLRVQPFEVWKRIAWNTWGDDPAVATHRDADIDAAISAQQRQGAA